MSFIVQGDVTQLLSAYPRLETLVIRGSEMEFKRGRYESLRSLTLQTAGLPAEVVRAVAYSDMPNLTHLELWLGTDERDGDATVDDLLAILNGRRLPVLTSLGLRNAQIADQVAAALAGAPVVARLQELDLCPAPGLMETANTRRIDCHGGTTEVPG